jgi:hypothetical protein
MMLSNGMIMLMLHMATGAVKIFFYFSLLISLQTLSGMSYCDYPPQSSFIQCHQHDQHHVNTIYTAMNTISTIMLINTTMNMCTTP